jgi:membrane protein YdbS with pleckstrin-like domain
VPRGAAGGAPLFTSRLGRWEYPRETMENTPAQRPSSAVGTLGKKVIAWLVVAAAAIIALKLIIGAVMGIVTFALTIVLVVAVIVAVMWALRHL